MAYASDIGIVNGGLYDAWNVARAPGYGMAYFNRTDLPYYYDLMDNFLIGDQYFQSTFTATNPNRLHLFSGSNGLSVPNSGYCQLDDRYPRVFIVYARCLVAPYPVVVPLRPVSRCPGSRGRPWVKHCRKRTCRGKCCRVQTTSMTTVRSSSPYRSYTRFDVSTHGGLATAFAWFASFRESKPGDPLYDRGMARVNDLVQAFADQVGNDTLPQVTWIVGPTSLSEHATNHPASGEDLSHQLINVLADPANADVYAKTAFIANYDEGGQFFDHLWTPTPPMNATDGKSTVTVDGELTLKEEFGIAPGHPIGLGFRVPFYIVSPWTRGDYTYSEVCDHTSVIQFIEQRFGVHCPNISPWRRAVTGDLTNAFDWDNPDLSFPTNMPVTKNNVNESAWQCEHLPAPTIPTVQQLAHQEAGVRKARALPYTFDITDSVAADGTVTITMANKGTGTGAFLVHDNRQPYNAPRKFTVEGGKTLSDTWASTLNKYNISLYGPNGFVRKFTGELPAAAGVASVRLEYLEAEDAVRVAVAAPAASAACTFVVTDNAYNLGGPWSLAVAGVEGAGSVPVSHVVDLSSVGNWYDLTVSASVECGMGRFERRFMGHMENGKDSITGVCTAALPPRVSAAPAHMAVPLLCVCQIRPWDSLLNPAQTPIAILHTLRKSGSCRSSLGPKTVPPRVRA